MLSLPVPLFLPQRLQPPIQHPQFLLRCCIFRKGSHNLLIIYKRGTSGELLIQHEGFLHICKLDPDLVDLLIDDRTCPILLGGYFDTDKPDELADGFR